MTYVLIKNPNGKDFEADTNITNFGVHHVGVSRKDNVTLLMEQLAFDQSPEIRQFIVNNYPKSDVACANVIINQNQPVFIERPSKIVHDWNGVMRGVDRDEKTILYTKADGLVLPKSDGWYVPVLSGDGTSKLILYHPLTGLPLETIKDRDEAVKRLVPYIKQVREVDDEEARHIAKYEVSRFFKEESTYEQTTAVLCVNGGLNDGPRVIDIRGYLSARSGYFVGDCGIRRFRWPNDETEKTIHFDADFFKNIK